MRDPKCPVCYNLGVYVSVEDARIEKCEACDVFPSDVEAARAAATLLFALHEIIETVEATGGCALDETGMHNPLASFVFSGDIAEGWVDLGEPVVAAMLMAKLEPTIHPYLGGD